MERRTLSDDEQQLLLREKQSISAMHHLTTIIKYLPEEFSSMRADLLELRHQFHDGLLRILDREDVECPELPISINKMETVLFDTESSKGARQIDALIADLHKTNSPLKGMSPRAIRCLVEQFENANLSTRPLNVMEFIDWATRDTARDDTRMEEALAHSSTLPSISDASSASPVFVDRTEQIESCLNHVSAIIDHLPTEHNGLSAELFELIDSLRDKLELAQAHEPVEAPELPDWITKLFRDVVDPAHKVRRIENMEDETCQICHAPIGVASRGNEILQCPIASCGQPYHKKCISGWLAQAQNQTCPNCRNVFPNDEGFPRLGGGDR